MPDAFFQKKRKRSAPSGEGGSGRSRSKAAFSSTSSVKKGKARRIDSDAADSGAESSDDNGRDAGGLADIDTRHDYGDDDDQRARETHAQARVRLAKAYLEGIRSEQKDEQDDLTYGADAAEVDRQNIAARLQRDVEEQSSRMHVYISAYLSRPSTSKAAAETGLPPADPETLADTHLSSDDVLAVRGHRQSVTSTALTPDARFLYTAGKDGHVYKWDLRDGRMVRILGKRQRTSAVAGAAPPAHAQPRAVPQPKAAVPQSKRSGAARRRARAEARGASGQSGAAGPMEVDGEAPSKSLFVPLEDGEGHTDEVLALAVSPDGKYLVTGGRDTRIGVWSIPSAGSTQPEKWLRGLRGHKDAITSLRFRQSLASPYELFSASCDRSIKLWAVDQLSYIETLFGHQDPVLDMDMLRDEAAVSAGGRDRTLRYWKVRNESQLIFRAGGLGKGSAAKTSRDMLEGGDLFEAEHKDRTKFKTAPKGADLVDAEVTGREFFEGSVDCVAMIDENHFLSGGDSGAISLWNTGKKKPIFTRLLAHGHETFEAQDELDDRRIHQPRWITSLACLPYGDVFASGSWDGQVRLWALDRSLRSFKQLYSIPAPGFVNSLRLLTPAQSKKTQVPYIQPQLWRRKGGLVDMTKPDEAAKPFTNGHLNGHAAHSDAEEDEDEARKVRIAKERTAPLLIVGLGKESRLGRWTKLSAADSPDARNGTLIITLPLKE